MGADFKECGAVADFRLPRRDDGSSKGVAFIRFVDEAGLTKALEFNQTDYGGRIITVRKAGEKGEDKGKGSGKDKGKGKAKGGEGKGTRDNNENTLFIGGLRFDCDQEEVRRDFEECGVIEAFRVPLNEDGTIKGIAFIKFKDSEGMNKAMEFNDTDYGGRTLSVRPAGDKSGGKGKDGKGKGKDGKGKGKDG